MCTSLFPNCYNDFITFIYYAQTFKINWCFKGDKAILLFNLHLKIVGANQQKGKRRNNKKISTIFNLTSLFCGVSTCAWDKTCGLSHSGTNELSATLDTCVRPCIHPTVCLSAYHAVCLFLLNRVSFRYNNFLFRFAGNYFKFVCFLFYFLFGHSHLFFENSKKAKKTGDCQKKNLTNFTLVGICSMLLLCSIQPWKHSSVHCQQQHHHRQPTQHPHYPSTIILHAPFVISCGCTEQEQHSLSLLLFMLPTDRQTNRQTNTLSGQLKAANHEIK